VENAAKNAESTNISAIFALCSMRFNQDPFQPQEPKEEGARSVEVASSLFPQSTNHQEDFYLC
jgi:hypothetical protein